MAAKEFTAPEWVFPGAQVVTSEVVRGDVRDAWLSTVDKVGKGWITLKGFGPKIAIDRLESANQNSGPYSTRIYRITEQYTEDGQKLLNDSRIRRATSRLNAQFEAWKKDPRNETIRAGLRKALNQLDTAIEKASE